MCACGMAASLLRHLNVCLWDGSESFASLVCVLMGWTERCLSSLSPVDEEQQAEDESNLALDLLGQGEKCLPK